MKPSNDPSFEKLAEIVYDKLKDKGSLCFEAANPFWKERCRNAAQAIAEACTPKWISVEERLPENGSYALVFSKRTLDMYTDEYKIHEPWTTVITHWMPLPEGPRP